jgi:hypothetical protein
MWNSTELKKMMVVGSHLSCSQMICKQDGSSTSAMNFTLKLCRMIPCDPDMASTLAARASTADVFQQAAVVWGAPDLCLSRRTLSMFAWRLAAFLRHWKMMPPHTVPMPLKITRPVNMICSTQTATLELVMHAPARSPAGCCSRSMI